MRLIKLPPSKHRLLADASTQCFLWWRHSEGDSGGGGGSVFRLDDRVGTCF